MATFSVGPGQPYSTIREAVSATEGGDTVEVTTGTYRNDFFDIWWPLTLTAKGEGYVEIAADQPCPNGKAISAINGGDGTVTITGFAFSGATVGDHNGAGIRWESGNLTLADCYFHDCENGLMGGEIPGRTLKVIHCEFSHNGRGDGYTHNIYVGHCATFEASDSYFHEANLGHEVKCRAESTIIRNCRIFTLDATASYCIDLPNGGDARVTGCTLQQGPNSDSQYMVTWGVEGESNQGTAVSIDHNTFVNERADGLLLYNKGAVLPALTENQIYGLSPDRLVGGGGGITASGNTYVGQRPPLDTSPIVPGAPPSQPVPPEPPIDVPPSPGEPTHPIVGTPEHPIITPPPGEPPVVGGGPVIPPGEPPQPEQPPDEGHGGGKPDKPPGRPPDKPVPPGHGGTPPGQSNKPPR